MSNELAGASKTTALEPCCPIHLDPLEQQSQDAARREHVQSAFFVDRLIKINALFANHLVLRDSHILDHLGMRNLLLGFDEEEFRDFAAFATLTAHDELGPLLFTSTPFSPESPVSPFPLADLLKRHLGLDPDPRYSQYAPWEISSVFVAHELEAANAAIRNAPLDKRYAIALQAMGPSNHYQRYLDRASFIWDNHADLTRLPRPENRGFKELLVDRFRQIAESSSSEAPVAARFLDELPKLRLMRGVLDPWLRSHGAPDLQWDVGETYHAAFLQSFPSAWLNADDARLISHFTGPDSNADSRPKREPSEALAKVAAELPVTGSICLDTISYSDLLRLRKDNNFHASLQRIRAEWRDCSNQTELLRALGDHVELIYGALRTNKDTSTRNEKVKIVVSAGAREGAKLAMEELYISALSPSEHHLAYWAVARGVALIATISGLFESLPWGTTRRQWKHLAKQIGEAAVITTP